MTEAAGPSPNATTLAYLRAYLASERPGFAVLLAAPWGAGKTHLVQSLVEDIRKTKPEDTPLYVSLFGVRSREEIERAILMARLPVLDNAWTKALGSLTGVALRYLRVELSLDDLARVALPTALIFDDLERTSLPPRDILGAINGFVERDGKRVILLANEERLWGEAKDEKEKVIGRTLPVVPDIDAALKVLLARCAAARDWLNGEAATVREVFWRGGNGNLRALGQALWDFDRLFAALEPRLRDNADAMRALLRVFLALSLEVKAGKLTREDLQRRGALDFKGETPDLARLRAAREKYGDEEILGKLDFSVLSPDLSAELICDGALDPGRLNAALSETPHFRDPKDVPEWATVLRVMRETPQAVRDACAAMEGKFAARAYVIPGEILHVFNARMTAGAIGLIGKSLPEIEAECRACIRDLCNQKRLPAAETLHVPAYDRTSYGGYGFPHPYEGESDDVRCRREAFWRLEEELRAQQAEVLRQSFDEKAHTILKMIEAGDTDGVRSWLFRSKAHADGEWLRLPVLQGADAATFAKALSRYSGAELAAFVSALGGRYSGQITEVLGEAGFLERLIQALSDEADRIATSDAVHAWQIRANVKRDLRPALDCIVTGPEEAAPPAEDGKA